MTSQLTCINTNSILDFLSGYLLERTQLDGWAQLGILRSILLSYRSV